MNKIITIIGSGYVGTTLSAILSNVGYKTFCLDVNLEKINILKGGKSHFFEVGLDDLIKNGLKAGNLIPTTSYIDSIPYSDIVFSCVGTPDGLNGELDLSYINSAFKDTVKNQNKNIIFVQRSTVPVGTGKKLLNLINNKNSLKYVSNPEFLAEGRAVLDSINPSRIVLGSDDKASMDQIADIFINIYKYSKNLKIDKLVKFADTYSNFSNEIKEPKIIKTSLESAELIKVTSNAFLATKISFANSIAMLADATGADINEVMDGVGLDNRIGRSFLYAGLGFGGGCFPKDLSGLISSFNYNLIKSSILQEVSDLNEIMPQYLINKIKKLEGSLKDKQIGFLGLSFKPGTSDIRKSQSINLINLLSNESCKINAFDPSINKAEAGESFKNIQLKTSIEDSIKNADIVIMGTEWPQFINYEWSKAKNLMKGNLIVDARNRLDKSDLLKIGFRYVGIGR